MQAFAATWGSDGVLNLEGEFDLTFMDSTGIRVLQTLAQVPGATRVVLRSPRRGVQKVLELVGIAKRPPIAGGEGEQASREDFFIF